MISSAKVGDIISLRDEQSLEELMNRGSNETSLDITVTDILSIREANGIASWTRFRFDDPDTILIVKRVGDNVDTKSCFEPEGYRAGDRKDLIEYGWFDNLFEPEEEGINLNDINYLDVLTINYDDIGPIDYHIKEGTYFGKDNEGRFCSVTEWSTEQDCYNPEIIVLEIGGEDSENGGLIHLYQGVNLFSEEYELLK